MFEQEEIIGVQMGLVKHLANTPISLSPSLTEMAKNVQKTPYPIEFSDQLKANAPVDGFLSAQVL